jgi:hypothetical protein
VFIRDLEDRTEYVERDIPDSFGTPATNNEEGAALVVYARNSGTSGGNGTAHDKGTGKRVNPVQDMGTRSKEVEAADASVTFGVG